MAAINKLESDTYFQCTRSIEEYLDEFRDLITESGYQDKRVVVVKFRRGLQRNLQNAIATIPSRRPADNNPEGWFEAALMYDQNHAANEAFMSSATRTALPPAPAAA